MTWKTLGEAFVERELKKERRAGTEHYVVGQHHAEIVEPDDPRETEEWDAAILSYVNLLGVVLIPMGRRRPAGEWEPVVGAARTVGLSVDYGPHPLPDDWELTDEMKAALKRAEP